MWLCAVLRMKQGVGRMLQIDRVTGRNGQRVSRLFNHKLCKALNSLMAFWEGDDIISFSFLACSFKGNLASSVLICLCPVPGALKGEGHKCMLVARVNVFFQVSMHVYVIAYEASLCNCSALASAIGWKRE